MRITAILFTCIVALSSCIDNPEYPATPKISFDNIYFVEGGTTDSLAISINFTDGDGNLGLRTTEKLFPFHQYSFYSKVNGKEINSIYTKPITEAIFLDSVLRSIIIRYEQKRTGEIDSLPEYAPCSNWLIVGSDPKRDTIYYQPNPYHYNIYVKFYVNESNTGEFKEFLFPTNNSPCGSTYPGRFPVLNDLNKEKSIEGTLTYTIKGVFLKDHLENKFIKIRIYIYDRGFNRSNTVESGVFTLDEITI